MRPPSENTSEIQCRSRVGRSIKYSVHWHTQTHSSSGSSSSSSSSSSYNVVVELEGLSVAVVVTKEYLKRLTFTFPSLFLDNIPKRLTYTRLPTANCRKVINSENQSILWHTLYITTIDCVNLVY